jgi:hypothetical protein
VSRAACVVGGWVGGWVAGWVGGRVARRDEANETANEKKGRVFVRFSLGGYQAGAHRAAKKRLRTGDLRRPPTARTVRGTALTAVSTHYTTIAQVSRRSQRSCLYKSRAPDMRRRSWK